MVETKSMNMPKISIIVPVYKAEAYLHRCVDSILAQTFTEWEMILVDDGSPDRSGEICDEYALRDDRIKVFHKQNGGPSSSRNLGIEHAQGKYIWFVDSDDWIEHGALRRIFNVMDNSNADVCFFYLNPISNSEVQVPFDFKSIVGNNVDGIHYVGKQECAKAFVEIEMIGGMGWTWNKWFKKSIIDENHIRFDTRFAIQEDHLFTLSYLLHINHVIITDYAPYNYVMQSGTLLTRKYSFENTKMRNEAMYEARCRLCKTFMINNLRYENWYTSDYISRRVLNLRNFKNSNLTIKERIGEIKTINELVKKNNVDSTIIRKYKKINWLPANIVNIIVSL